MGADLQLEEFDFWMVVCRDKYTGEMVGFKNTLYVSRKEALAQRRTIVGLRESVIRVEVREVNHNTPKKGR